RTQSQITFGQGMHNNPESIDVEHLRKGFFLLDHFSENTIERFFATDNISLDAGCGQGRLDGPVNFAQHLTAVATGGEQGLAQYLIPVWTDGLKATILQFSIQGIEAQTMRYGSIDIQGL